MELVQKGQTANLSESFKQLKLTASWLEASDLDIAALWEKRDGTKGIVYFGKLGDLNAFPYIKLDKDAGVGDKVAAGGNQETLKITKLDDMKTVHLVVWDYGNIQRGEAGRFSGSLKVVLVDDTNTNHTVKLDGSTLANVVVIATIDNSSPVGPKLVNTSKFGTLKGLDRDDPLWAIANS